MNRVMLSLVFFWAFSPIVWAQQVPDAWMNFFHLKRLNVLVFLLGFFIIFLILLAMARRGRALYLRRIPGLDAVDEAIGRATEMGKPILFVNGLESPAIISTIAAINILSQVAQKVAEYETPLRVPNEHPVTFVVEREVVKDAYTKAGKADVYDPESVFFIAGTQFAYAAAVSGYMMREKPATNLLLGYFYAESLILAEAGAVSGAIQIAGTDAVTQLPFFVAACDYTLLGEELYAASAYLSRDPLHLSALKTQDFFKIIVAGAVLVVLFSIFFYGILLQEKETFEILLNFLKTR